MWYDIFILYNILSQATFRTSSCAQLPIRGLFLWSVFPSDMIISNIIVVHEPTPNIRCQFFGALILRDTRKS